jgi:hypothetical protein
MFYTNTRSPVKPIYLYGPLASYDRDFERAQQDRTGGGGLVSVAYWIARGMPLARRIDRTRGHPPSNLTKSYRAVKEQWFALRRCSTSATSEVSCCAGAHARS